MEDRDAVYQARFSQSPDNNKIIIHENLTEARANMVRILGQLREKGKVVNYHTKNGTIYARNSREKKYTQIEPWLTEDDVLKAMETEPSTMPRRTADNLLKSQTLENIPHGHVARRAVDLSELVVPNKQARHSSTK